MSLAQSAFLFFLLLIPLLALGGWLASRQRRTAWQRLVAPRLRKKLAAPASPWSRWLSLGCGLLALSLLIICLAQPIAGERENTTLVKGRNIIIAVDASRSMLVRDVAPDRLNAAKTAVYELLDRFPNDRIGLLAFAGSASLQAPLTVDHNALRETLDQLNETNVPSGGSNLADAINLATKTFKETGQRTHGLIVLSDGELHEGELSDASFDARQAGVFVVSIGIGTREGDFVPDPEQNDGRFRDRSGKPVLSRLNPEPLRTLAGETGGLYLEGVGSDFAEKIDTVISRLDAFEDEGRIQKTPVPRFQWFLIPAMILMIANLLLRYLWSPARPRAVASSPALLVLVGSALLGSSPEASAWKNPLEGFLGARALKKGNYEEAQKHFERAAENAVDEELAKLRYGQGEAAFKAGKYSESANFFAEALLSEESDLQRDAHGQIANTLYLRTLERLKTMSEEKDYSDVPQLINYLEDALEHYDSALEIDPKHQPSIKNKEATEKALEQLRDIEQQQQQQQQQEQDGEEGEESEEQEGQEGDEEQEGEDGEQGEKGEQQDGENQENGEQGQQGDEGEEQEGQQGENEGENEQGGEEESQGESQSGDEGEQQEAQSGSAAQRGQARPAPREDETAEEFARRILKENADFQKEALLKHRRQVVPNKDW